jgi:hypothetical protein
VAIPSLVFFANAISSRSALIIRAAESRNCSIWR